MKTFHSKLYDCEVFHSRQNPCTHRFTYRYFTFCLDLDEVKDLSKKFIFFGIEYFKPFRFVSSDSLLGSGKNTPNELKESVIRFAERMGIRTPIARVELLAHVRTLGYSYNPAAFYFGYDFEDRLLFGIVEVTNTFHEKKAYFVPVSANPSEEAIGVEQKLFYISPFVELDTQFEFKLKRPGEKLYIQIDSTDPKSALILHAALKGQSRPITDFRLFFYLIRYPFLTLGVMLRIHIQALRLYLKRVPFHKKSDRTELQKGGLP